MPVKEKIREPQKRKRNPDRKAKDLAMPAQEISPTTAAELRSSGYNPRTITSQQLDSLKQAMKEFGDLGGIVFNRSTGRLVSGHQRGKNLDPTWTIVKEEIADSKGTVAHGYVDTPDGRFSYREVAWDETREIAANIAANQQGGDFDYDLLAELTQRINAEDSSLVDLLGFDDLTLKELLAEQNESELGEEDPDVEPVEDPFVKMGDMWICGESRILCGDSTSIADVDKLMMGEKADLVVTDPPYGISYESKAGKIENDDLKPDALESFLTAAFTTMAHALKPGGSWYCYHADGGPLGLAFRRAIASVKNLLLKQTLIWVKNTATLCRSTYNMQHEPCLFGWLAGGPHWYDGDFSRTSVIDDDININNMDKKALQNLVNDLRQRIPSTVIRIDKPSKSEHHPTQKPIRLFERNIMASSRPGEIVLDLFNGSGTTTITCRKTGRKGRGMEFDPKYLQASLMRYRDYCNEEPMLMDDKGKLTPYSQVEKQRKKSK